jgi:hypothetical protein
VEILADDGAVLHERQLPCAVAFTIATISAFTLSGHVRQSGTLLWQFAQIAVGRGGGVGGAWEVMGVRWGM